ncbi:MAG: PadR family transcriptional regulator [Oscillospiraceae bacterium]|nr:PadR family transcriptional regulator [Oscillospiraceae bacterium]MDY6208997.1 PadR family transcriptional regulator [Oscillospiraceae bacterium]
MDKGQMKKGVLELSILYTLTTDELYGYDIMKRITELFPEINESTVYAVLRRLHADGCTECYFGEHSGGPKRKYYRVTPKGREELRKMLSEWRDITGAMEKLGIK